MNGNINTNEEFHRDRVEPFILERQKNIQIQKQNNPSGLVDYVEVKERFKSI